MAAPTMATTGMLQLTTASGVVMPFTTTAAADPDVRSTPAATTRRRRGGGPVLMRHSNRANPATRTAVTASKNATHNGRVNHQAVVPGSTRKTAPSKVNNPAAATRAIADKCHK